MAWLPRLSGLLLALVVLSLCGCATSTIEKRRGERSAAYQALSPEMRSLVDSGQIKIGMPMDAVYIAWGKPSQVFTGQSELGAPTTTWVYTGTTWQEYRYWRPRYYGYRGYHQYGGPSPYLDSEYVPRSYLSAQVIFENGVVKSWNTLAGPDTSPP